MVNGNGTAKFASDQFKPGTAPQLQHGLVENTAHHINVFAKVAENFPCILRSVLKGDDLKFDVRSRV